VEEVGGAWGELAAKAAADVGKAEEKARASESKLRAVAGSAGLADSVERHLAVRDVDALMADHASRTERLAHLLKLPAEHDKAEQRAERSAASLEKAERTLSVTRDGEHQAQAEVAERADVLREQIRDWSRTARAAQCPAHLAETWCDLIPALTVVDEEAGPAHTTSSPVDAIRAHVKAAHDALTRRAEQVRLLRAPLQTRYDEADAALEETRARGETPPAHPATWMRRTRPSPDDEAGAPLWRLVNPSRHVEEQQLARLEAALAASGLLDSWVSPQGQLSTRDGQLIADVQPVVGPQRSKSNLLAVLEPDSAGGVEPTVVQAVLAGIGWHDTAASAETGDWLAADGCWRVGGLVGRAELPAPASYLGAAAREAATRHCKTGGRTIRTRASDPCM
jgi:hypothetical protein